MEEANKKKKWGIGKGRRQNVRLLNTSTGTSFVRSCVVHGLSAVGCGYEYAGRKTRRVLG